MRLTMPEQALQYVNWLLSYPASEALLRFMFWQAAEVAHPIVYSAFLLELLPLGWLFPALVNRFTIRQRTRQAIVMIPNILNTYLLSLAERYLTPPNIATDRKGNHYAHRDSSSSDTKSNTPCRCCPACFCTNRCTRQRNCSRIFCHSVAEDLPT